MYAHDSCLENAWFARVCVSLKKKKKKGRRVATRRVTRSRGGFRKEEIFQRALPSDRGGGGEDGTRNSRFGSFFLFFSLVGVSLSLVART